MTHRINSACKLFLFLAIWCYVSTSFAGGGHKHSHHDASASAVGNPTKPSESTRLIKVSASDDMRFKFSRELNLNDGDVITFVISNKGKVPHEFSIGNEKEQKNHQIMMRKNPSMVHSDGNSVTIKPGETKKLTWKFKGDGLVVFACNIPGHYEAGMYKKVRIDSK